MNGFFKGKVYGAVTVGERGQLVIPADLRRDLGIKAGDRLMIFAKIDRKMIGIMREKDFSDFLQKASKIISKLEGKVIKED
ncbi:MAG: AbrB/MazE/SpoVT family DNA-binding domain-containing protein [Candidatus Omnitrophica bacterium]|nr:AbrB/MazE/SpoVT family DNA-binding domain-containing protein [Candidatus Omnitrophota bacterium]